MGKRLAKRQRHPGWHLALSGLLLAGAILFLLYTPSPDQTGPLSAIAPATKPVPYQATNASQLADTLYAGIDSALADLGIWPALYSKHRREYFDQIKVGVPADLPLAEANLGISRFVQQFGGQVLSASERRGKIEIRCGFGEVQTTIFTLAPVAERRRTGNIAIVIDDFTDDDPIAAHFCAIPQPLTFSILPRVSQAHTLVETDARQRARGVDPPANGTQRRGVSRWECHTSRSRRRGNPPASAPRLAKRAPRPWAQQPHGIQSHDRQASYAPSAL